MFAQDLWQILRKARLRAWPIADNTVRGRESSGKQADARRHADWQRGIGTGEPNPVRKEAFEKWHRVDGKALCRQEIRALLISHRDDDVGAVLRHLLLLERFFQFHR